MQLKEFIKNALQDIINGVEDVRTDSVRDVRLTSNKEKDQTVEFDIAVTVESNNSTEAGGGIKVFQVIQAEGAMTMETKNSSITRIKFGVHVEPLTKDEREKKTMLYHHRSKEILKNQDQSI